MLLIELVGTPIEHLFLMCVQTLQNFLSTLKACLCGMRFLYLCWVIVQVCFNLRGSTNYIMMLRD